MTSLPSEFIVDYSALYKMAQGNSIEETHSLLIDELSNLWAEQYRTATPWETEIAAIPRGAFTYIFDCGASINSSDEDEDRLVAAIGCSAPQEEKRDDGRLKGWVGPTEQIYGREWDKGHFIAHSIGGAVDRCELNVFVQRRDLNRGWSDAGKTFRLMEKYCQENAGTLCFHRPIYMDKSSRPALLEFGLLKKNGDFWVEIFDNQ